MLRPNTPWGTRTSRGRAATPKREQGQIIVLFVLAVVVIMGFAALVIDVGVLRNSNQNLWNALDAGALAGACQGAARSTRPTPAPWRSSTPTSTIPAACPRA